MVSGESLWDALPRVPTPLLRQLGLKLEAARCPRELEGKWKIHPKSSEPLCPFLTGLGMPGVICPAVGLLERTTELTISCPGPASSGGVDRVRFEDKTALSSRNVTDVTTDGEETEKATKTGRKRYMLSGAVDVASGAA
eukprot:CAMPEP_0198679424 /NCGR_PEP_ID=MMETSP1468-20131203/2738_1 /TAXON_ID=1461545 /ORGANISM="Mantoniella sp, Strain CCMP1436" /LENGTH=138 /DNA_ID=CAMNT_0044418133 /DNA_START=236 /DNA_END=649 /DNA_ORIENTATION=-